MTKDGIKKWFVAAGVRAVKTAAQTALAATAAVASVLTSIVGVPEVEEGTSPLSKQQ